MDIRVVRQANVTPQELAAFLENALFCPSDDAEAGSYEQQQQWFSDEADDLSITLLQSHEACDLNAIKRTIARDIAWRLPKDRSFIIRIAGGTITVEGLPSVSADDPTLPSLSIEARL